MTDEEIYQKFIDYMDNPVWEFTESEHMMPMIKAHISPEEAEFLMDVPVSGSKSLEEIAAIELKFSTQSTNKFRKAVKVDSDLCIRCGVCIYKCKTKAITLKRKEETTRPHKDMKELVMKNAIAALAAKAQQK